MKPNSISAQLEDISGKDQQKNSCNVQQRINDVGGSQEASDKTLVPLGLGAGLQRPKKAKSKDHESDQEENSDKSSEAQQSPADAKEEAADATETAADIKPPSGLQSYLSKCLKVTTKQSCHQIVLVSQCTVLHLEINALYV